MTMTTTGAPLVADLPVDQRGRAELDFLRAVRGGLAPLRTRIRERLQAGGAFDGPFTTIEALRAGADAQLRDAPDHRVTGAVLRWARDQQTPRATALFDRNRDRLLIYATPRSTDPVDDRLGEQPPPRYWTYEFHGTTGGWDGHEHMGFIHHELVYGRLLTAAYGGDIFAQRTTVAQAAPRDDYARIADLGCGTGQYTMKLAEVYPQARITGVDLSHAELVYARRRAEQAGHDWHLVRAPAEDTTLPADSFDLVTSFILLHEVPPHITRKIFAEAFRLLAPGGDVHMSDVAPYRLRSGYQAWADDWDAENGSEPWWRSAATMDLASVATDAGFVEVRQAASGRESYPWVLTARKPAAAA
ncbi:class I SAM-dependent methyltransferase [Actinoplanes derwentensis]|uniref:Methyltransferase domain-containing protein n=1 Tax=Actinoplanes derwentensis TaxID=113562 RepID=A0A1H1ZT28_9ACTN|nr:class I SAM-dependent methyltransferase [Actinoplanes derwentensis]GID83567.1 hypothetical protein Ade03nite_24910 [Actinoplanes derwentensis]SDT36737.1 Methyltransferase domain-containing protein [Actinoplanes derwentensis]